MQKILHLIGVQDSIAVLTKIGTFRQIGKGVGGMAGVLRGLWCDPEKFFCSFFPSVAQRKGEPLGCPFFR